MRNIFLFLISFFSLFVQAQIPSNYYNTAVGKSGASLKTALYNIVASHTEVDYANLWTAFSKTDKKDDGSVWDVYSNCPFTFSSNQCGNYTNVCDCYNREHSMPKSWFNDEAPMYSDLFHIYPTDGKVNGQRANYPFGECASGTSLTSTALGKLGKSTYSTYTATVFEPADEFKGDFARTYFYMVTCYEDKVSTWVSDQLAGNAYPAFSAWSVSLFLKWNAQDPVSDKEINRNNVIYSNYQHNRNPFIDHPELADYVWGDKANSAWSLTAAQGAVPADDIAVLQITRDRIFIQNSEKQAYSYRIIDSNARVLESGNFSGEEYSITIDGLASGMYVFELSSSQSAPIARRKFVK